MVKILIILYVLITFFIFIQFVVGNITISIELNPNIDIENEDAEKLARRFLILVIAYSICWPHTLYKLFTGE